ncbi:MAG TPA: hypothetical protein VHO68_03820, partial [Bacteroidales bacterium]|nr:hypothetical protein [Bacteroidales bacterium]
MFSHIRHIFFNRVFKSFTLVLLWLIYGNSIFAQVENRISGISLVEDKSIVLRWAPSSVSLWQTGIKYGYIIRKYTIARDGVFIQEGLSKAEVLNSIPLKPVSEESFDSLAIIDKRAAIVQEAVYGKVFQNQASADFAGFLNDYSENEMKFGMALFMCDMSPEIAGAAGLRFEDINVRNGERYAYSVSLANVPDGFTYEPAVIIADAGFVTRLPEINDVQSMFLDRAVKFRWPAMIYKKVYSAYILEKSSDGKSFHPVSDLPIVNLSEMEEPEYFTYTDSLESNGKQYWYRIKGISPFGITGPSSEVITGKGKPEFSAYATIDTAYSGDKNSITIKWRVAGNAISPVKGIKILRAASYNGPYTQINPGSLSGSTRMFTDKRPLATNYYQIMLSGKDELKSYSFPFLFCMEDKEPPARPEFLAGNVDSSGVVTLLWKENTETDLLGYKLFRSNSAAGEFVPMKHGIINGNSFHDSVTLNTLSRKIYYQLVALDKNYNASDYSLSLELKRPDTIPPSPGLLTQINSLNGLIAIKLQNSPSNDIKEYNLFRKSGEDTIVFHVFKWTGQL